jgi:RNA polymerase sigma-70 factor (ECF subfamily)
VLRAAERARSEQVALGAGRAGPLPDEAVQAAELARALGAAVDALPERRRLVVICRWRHQLSYAEIAQVLGISVKTVEVQMGRALAALRTQLARLER